VLPLLIWSFLRGASRLRVPAMYLLVIAGITGGLVNIYRVREGMRRPEEAGFVQAVEWLKENASPADRVLSRYPTWVAAVTGNRGERWNETNEAAIHHQLLLNDDIKWVIVDHNKVLREA